MLSREEIARLLPHGEGMVLIDFVDSMDTGSIACRSGCHRDVSNPLRSRATLPAAAGVELAAQAVAIHGMLAGPPAGVPAKIPADASASKTVREGMVVLVRDLHFDRSDLDVDEDWLFVHATLVSRNDSGCLADFRIESGGQPCVRGRIGIRFGGPGEPV